MRCALLACLAAILIAGGCSPSHDEASLYGIQRLTDNPKVKAMQAIIKADQRRLLRGGATRVDHAVTIGDRATGGSDFVRLSRSVGHPNQTTSYDISFSPTLPAANQAHVIETVEQPPGPPRITLRQYSWIAKQWIEQPATTTTMPTTSPTTSPSTPG